MTDKATHDYATPWHVVPGIERNPLCWEVRSANGQLLSYRATITDEDKRFMHLISAAPELLKTLTVMVEQMKSTSAWLDALEGEDEYLRNAVADAEAAIAKAGG